MTTKENNNESNQNGETDSNVKVVEGGATTELSKFMFSFGQGHQGNCDKTKTGIADHCGRRFGRLIKQLFCAIDEGPTKPTRPTTKREETDGWEVFEHEKTLTEWMKKN